ncbi:hypothetical protein L6452_19663 [Arctium lappa]|uniref:Uncharacterized protein n=1 Tax=Arctium lappa TaxID=4217 RepID=A0ACB9BA38_ARCLA|nr:hypothetical protein L6452_19663 [Arctium lappa]
MKLKPTVLFLDFFYPLLSSVLLQILWICLVLLGALLFLFFPTLNIDHLLPVNLTGNDICESSAFYCRKQQASSGCVGILDNQCRRRCATVDQLGEGDYARTITQAQYHKNWNIRGTQTHTAIRARAFVY